MHSNIINYLNKNDWRVKENSNQNFSLQGLNAHVTGVAMTDYWLDHVFPKHVADAHRSGAIHIHDLSGSICAYCAGWDLVDLLLNGLGGVPGKPHSAPARHFRTATMHMVNFLYVLQNEVSGAVAFSNVDTLLAPFIKEDGLSYDEVKQVLQEFIFNLNVPTRIGQSSFTNLSMDLTVPSNLATNPAIVGGKPMSYTYGDVQEHMDVFNAAFSEVMLEGDADGRPFTFPIPTISITKDFDWDNPVLEPLWKATAKYGIPYFSNFINSDLDTEDIRSLCCHLSLDVTKLQHRGSGLFGSAPLVGSLGICTINLPQAALRANNDADAFFRNVAEAMGIAKESLILKRQLLEESAENGLYPFLMHYMRSIKKETGHYFSNHFSTIGIIGMHEALGYLFGIGIEGEEGKAFTIKTMEFINEILRSYQEETGVLWNLEATPAESATYRLAKIDGESFDDADELTFYTNSTNLPVEHTDDIYGAIRHQEDIQSKYTGGCVFHTYLGEPISDWKQARTLVRKIAESSKLPYFSISPTFSICPKHGYLSGEYEACPKCGEVTEVYTRVVGFLRPVSTFNKGKLDEFNERKEYKLS